MAVIQHLDSDGATPITGKTLPDIAGGATATAVKFGVENVFTRVLLNEQLPFVTGGGDGLGQSRMAPDTDTLSRPYGVTGILSGPGAGGTWASLGQRGWRITAVNAVGETPGSEKVVLNIVDVTQKATITWTQVAGATGYRVYRTDTPDVFGTTALRAVIGNGAVVTYEDTGGATSAGTVPTVNTTGGWLLALALSGAGAGGVWGGTGTVSYRVAARDAAGAILATTLEASIAVDNVTKTVTLTWPAVPTAVTYSVYRTTVPGVYVAALRATVSVATYVDVGGAVGAGDLTLSPSYGIPPLVSVFTVGPIAEGSLAIGQQVFWWFNRLVPISTPEAGNDRVVLVIPRET
jgi:hypothetical protein